MLPPGSQGDPAERADVRKIPPPGDGDVAFAGEDIVGGVGIDPTGGLAAEDGDPGVGGVRSGQFRFSGRRPGFQIAADVRARQWSEGRQA